MKFIHTADGPAPTQAEIAFFEQAGHKLAAGMQQGTTRRSYETVGSTGAYLVAGTPGLVNIHTVKDDPKTSLASLIALVPNTYGPTYTPPDFVAGYINNNGRYKNIVDPETDCTIPQLFPEPTNHTEYVSTEYAARKLAAVGGKLYGATSYPPQDDPEKGILYTQSSRKRPGYFTGMMSTMVQMLLGAGRFVGPSVYKMASNSKKVKNPLGSMQMGFDSRTGKMDEPPNPSHFQYMKPFEEGKCVGTSNTSDPFAMEVPWDYRWHRTHGLVRGLDENDKPLMFIVEISNAGIFAYPVQVDPFTKYTRVQKYMKKVYPWLDEPVFSGMDVFDAFGGIPLPTYYNASDRDVAVTKMKAARLGDASTFYAGTFISTMFGWAFSESTGEAANICVTTDPDGYNRANLFKIKIKGLRLTKAKDENGKNILAIQGSATCVNTQSGVFYHAGRPPINDPCAVTGVPQFHIYEPVIGRIISYDFRYGFRPTKARKCDAPMFCSYIKDDLHILYYYADESKVPKDVEEDTREECQVTGSWTTTVTYGSIRAGYFYNTTTDLRREIKVGGSSVTTTKEWPAFDYDMHTQVDFFSVLCMSSHHYFNHRSSKYETHGGEGWAVNVGTSNTDRSVYFSGSLYTKNNGSKGYGQGIVYAGRGPELRWSAFYYFISHWAGGTAPAPSASCMEPTDDYVETVPSCYQGGTESLVGKVKHYTLIAGGKESCGYWGGSATGGHYTGKGGFGNWFAIGGYNSLENQANRPPKSYPEPYLDTFELTGGHEVVFQVHVFGLPLANGKMIYERKATAPATEEAFGLEYAYDWFRFSLSECPVPTMPVCRNFYGRDVASMFNDRSHSALANIGQSTGIHPEAIPVGGIMK